MPIENRNLEAGTVLTARYKKQDRTCEVVETADGLRFRTDDGEVFRSPSSAAKHVMGGIAANGWRFWSVAGTEPAPKATTDEPAKAKKEPAAKAAAKPKTKAEPKKSAKAKSGKKPKAARAAAKGDAYGCGACGETFPTMKKATAHAMTHTA